MQFVGLAGQEGVTEGGMGDIEGLTDWREMGARGMDEFIVFNSLFTFPSFFLIHCLHCF